MTTTLPRPDAPAGTSNAGAFAAHAEIKCAREQQALAQNPQAFYRPAHIGKRLPMEMQRGYNHSKKERQ